MNAVRASRVIGTYTSAQLDMDYRLATTDN